METTLPTSERQRASLVEALNAAALDVIETARIHRQKTASFHELTAELIAFDQKTGHRFLGDDAGFE